ncbi:MAG: hypothetical protein FWH08_05360 [Oscillospiraceae bacterium]|nr:hypothetical protein [Oscillospiraceae bacterium]
MKKILEDLFYGRIIPINEQKDIKKLEQKLSEIDEELSKRLNQKELELFQSYTDTQNKIEVETALYNFKLGFKMGAGLIMEILP